MYLLFSIAVLFSICFICGTLNFYSALIYEHFNHKYMYLNNPNLIPQERKKFCCWVILITFYLHSKAIMYNVFTCNVQFFYIRDLSLARLLYHVSFTLAAIRYSRGRDVIPWDLLDEIDFFVLSYSLTLG